MGLINQLMTMVFGGGRNVITETAGVFAENVENAAVREAIVKGQAMRSFSAEFAQPQKSWFDRLIDGLNRLPRPMLAFGTIGLFVTAMVNPIWFASRMQGIALVPEPLWWLMGAIVSFYFGARHQMKGQEFQQSMTTTVTRAGQVTRNIAALDALDKGRNGAKQDPIAAAAPAPAQAPQPAVTSGNAALADWEASRG